MKEMKEHQQVTCLLCRRVVAVSQDRSELVVFAVRHLEHEHQIETGVVVEGVHVLFERAPMRCDLCGVVVEAPIWTYETTPDVALDPYWCVCGGCHELVEARTLPALLRRVLANQVENYAMEARDVRENAFPIVVTFLNSLVGPPVKESL